MTTRKPRKGRYGFKDFEKEYGTITFAEIIKSYRLCEELTQTELARILNITSASLCDLERGKKIPSPERAFAIASQLGKQKEHGYKQLFKTCSKNIILN